MIHVIPELVEQNGQKRVRITVRDGEQILDAEVVNPLNATQRKRVAQRLAERAGDAFSAERIEQALLQAVDLMTKKEEPPAEEPEVSAGDVHVVRPELILADGVVAVAVPQVLIRGGEAIGRWRLYLRWAEGKREVRELPSYIELKDGEGEKGGQRLWLYPQPPDPAVPVVSAWSEQSRNEWLKGLSPPTGGQVFLKLCEMFEEFLDLPQDVCGLSSVVRGDALESKDPLQTTNNKQQTAKAPSCSVSALALWTMLTYCYPAWDAVPYLYVSGPAGSGKTRVFELLSRLVFRPIGSSNLSAAALFRTLHERGGTLLLDEAERLNEGTPDVAELRSILLAGYKRGGRASRLESSGESYQMCEFQVFGPKAIACISGLPGPLASRCIPVQMFRSGPDSAKPRRRLDERPGRWQELRDMLHVLTLESMGRATLALSHCSELCNLSGRQYELWQPILALAEWVDGDEKMNLVHRLGEYAKSLILATQEQLAGDVEQLLLRVLTDRVLSGKAPTPKELLEKAQGMEKETMKGWTAKAVAEVLRRYGIVTKRSNGASRYRDVTLEQLKTIERNYHMELNTDGQSRLDLLEVRVY